MKIYWLICFVMLLFLLIVKIGLNIYNQTEIAATDSSARALYDYLYHHAPEDEFGKTITSEWKTLTNDEYDKLISSLSKSSSFSPDRKDWSVGQTLIDSWRQRFKIAWRRLTDKTIEIRVWSNGPDQRQGTSDDIVVP